MKKADPKQSAPGGCHSWQGKHRSPSIHSNSMSTSSTRPEVYLEKLSVIDADGEHLFWVSEDQARDMVRKGQVTVIRRKGSVRALRATSAFDLAYRNLATGRGTALDKTRYSHNHESEDNPEKVWTLRHLANSAQDVFLQVATDCGGVTVRHSVNCAVCGLTVEMQYAPPWNSGLLPAGWTLRRGTPYCAEHSRASVAA